MLLNFVFTYKLNKFVFPLILSIISGKNLKFTFFSLVRLQLSTTQCILYSLLFYISVHFTLTGILEIYLSLLAKRNLGIQHK